MKVAITGSNGFVGRRLVRILAREGHEVVPLVRAAGAMAGEVVMGDLGRGSIRTSELAGIDVMVHLAARTHILNETACDSLAAYRAVNVAGTSAVLDAAIGAGASRFIFMSSIKAVAERSDREGPISPETTPRPEDAYGITKREAEREVRRRCEEAGIEWVIIRAPLVYGPGVKANFQRLIALVGKRIPLPFGALRNRRSIVYVDNLADAIARACVAPGAVNRLLHIADSTLSTPELLRHIAGAMGVPMRLWPVPRRWLMAAGRALGRRQEFDRLCGTLEVDTRSSMADLDWRPPHGLEGAMRETVAAAMDGQKGGRGR